MKLVIRESAKEGITESTVELHVFANSI